MEINENRKIKMQRAEVWVHTLLFAHHAFAAIYLNVKVDFSQSKHQQVIDMHNFRYRYFTTWNFILQFSYLLIMCIYHLTKVLPQQTKKIIKFQKAISNLRGFLYTSLVFPTGVLVATIFWAVWYINRELVLPSVADEHLPSWVNHSMHTNIIILLVTEIFLCKNVPTFKNAFIGAIAFCLAYNTTFFFTYYQSSRWLYGMFGVLSWPERFLFMAFNFLISVALIKLVMFIQNNIHGRKLPRGGHHKLISKKLL